MARATDQQMALLESMAVAGLGAPVEPLEVLREIVASDLPLLAQEARERNWSEPSDRTIATLRTGHHQLAQLLAAGVKPIDAALVTGRSVGGIHTLLRDPAFKELMAHYVSVQEVKDFDAYQRLVTLGGTALEVLQERLEETPDKFSNNELRQIVESTMDRSAAPAKGDPRQGKGQGAGLSVSINFVPSRPTMDAEVIEATVVKQIEEKKE